MKSATSNPPPETLELATLAKEPMPIAAPEINHGITIESAFHAAATKALDKDSLDVMKQLLAMDAERKFNSAFVKMQSELPVIVASTSIPNRGNYEKYEDIMDKDGVAGILARNGFSVSYAQDFKENRIIVTCFLSHVGGHTRPNSFAARGGGKSDSETQADSKTSTTCKRNALIQSINLIVRQDVLNEENDAGIEGDPNAFVTAKQADELEQRAQLTNSNISAFLNFAKAKSFATIPANKYDELDAMLHRKEQGIR